MKTSRSRYLCFGAVPLCSGKTSSARSGYCIAGFGHCRDRTESNDRLTGTQGGPADSADLNAGDASANSETQQGPTSVIESLQPRRNHADSVCIRYTFDPAKFDALKKYVEAEQEPIARSGGRTIEYFLPTDYAGPTNEAMGLIDFPTLAEYERYRTALASDPDHKKNLARLEESGANVAMSRSIIQRIRHRA